jgi:hypothetical protein
MFGEQYVYSAKFCRKFITISTILKEFERTLRESRDQIYIRREILICTLVYVLVWMITNADIGTLFVVAKS